MTDKELGKKIVELEARVSSMVTPRWSHEADEVVVTVKEEPFIRYKLPTL